MKNDSMGSCRMLRALGSLPLMQEIFDYLLHLFESQSSQRESITISDLQQYTRARASLGLRPPYVPCGRDVLLCNIGPHPHPRARLFVSCVSGARLGISETPSNNKRTAINISRAPLLRWWLPIGILWHGIAMEPLLLLCPFSSPSVK